MGRLKVRYVAYGTAILFHPGSGPAFSHTFSSSLPTITNLGRTVERTPICA